MTELFEVENDVLIGRDGELFLASGGHRVMDYALGRRTLDPDIMGVFRSNIAARAELARRLGAQYKHVIFPDKQSVLAERFVTDNPIKLGALYVQGSDIAQYVLYPVDLLRSGELPVYQRTDTHLTDYGSILVATRLAESLSGRSFAEQRNTLEKQLVVKHVRQGDLGSKLAPPRENEELFARAAWPHTWLENSIPGGNNGGISIIVSPEAMLPKRVLWFGDSFGRAAARFLSFFFKEILFLRTPFAHPDIAQEMRPDIIVSGNVERYLVSCVSDEMRPCFHMFPFLGRGTVSASAEFAKAFTGIVSFPRQPYDDFIKSATAAAYAALKGPNPA